MKTFQICVLIIRKIERIKIAFGKFPFILILKNHTKFIQNKWKFSKKNELIKKYNARETFFYNFNF